LQERERERERERCHSTSFQNGIKFCPKIIELLRCKACARNM